ncbi:hypothetical protein FH063_004837 [Azospirillum argentinense]|uniref:Uncharacterized protein n=1 Tax=Azospirillum argentinense TaxID=2970906 RepID=A0A5B0KT49_9PROT|nr:hypothetical protein FH063_004837 [Azospirillum argentinense]
MQGVRPQGHKVTAELPPTFFALADLAGGHHFFSRISCVWYDRPVPADALRLREDADWIAPIFRTAVAWDLDL